MERLLVIAHCSPIDFINPFPSLAQGMTACAGLLLGMTVFVWWCWAARPALRARWLRYASGAVLALLAEGTIGAWYVALWLWDWSRAFRGWCGAPAFAATLEPQVHALYLGEHLLPVVLAVTGVLLLVGAAMSARLLARTGEERRPLAH